MGPSNPNSDSKDEIYTEFLEAKGHETETVDWNESHNKKQCPDCGGIHDDDAKQCTSCGWTPRHHR